MREEEGVGVGLLQTRWESRLQDGPRITVVRNEWTKGVTLRLEDTVVAAKAWSWIGLTRLVGSVEVGGRSARVEVSIGPRSSCELIADGLRLPTNRVG